MNVFGLITTWYLLLSALCFALYALDKSAAIARRRRISEWSLIIWGLLGGWPGAFLAQRQLRHKTNKLSFLIHFWISVILNLFIFIVFLMAYRTH